MSGTYVGAYIRCCGLRLCDCASEKLVPVLRTIWSLLPSPGKVAPSEQAEPAVWVGPVITFQAVG